MRAPLKAFFIVCRLFLTVFFKAVNIMRVSFEKKNNGWLQKNVKFLKNVLYVMELKYWRSHDMWEIEAPFISWRVDLQRLSAIVQIFLVLCTICITRKKKDFLKKIKFWNSVSWKRNGNSKIPNKLLETTVQQGYGQVWKE